VQRNAMASYAGKGAFADLLAKDKDVAQHLKPAQLKALFNDAYHRKHVDTIFKRVFGKA